VIRAVLFDFGGVIMRTEFQAPRERLAERLNMEYDDLVRLVFDSETSRKASLGETSAREHWAAVTRKLHRPASETETIRREFFAGDILDRNLVNFIRSLRGKYKTGLISNAWDDLRGDIEKDGLDDAFDTVIISAEVGVMKPEAAIFEFALKQLKVEAKEAVFVDDFAENIEGCEKVGMKGILFRDSDSAVRQLNALLQ
jgi:epoxide hydrolase-like predicted phosphatase